MGYNAGSHFTIPVANFKNGVWVCPSCSGEILNYPSSNPSYPCGHDPLAYFVKKKTNDQLMQQMASDIEEIKRLLLERQP